MQIVVGLGSNLSFQNLAGADLIGCALQQIREQGFSIQDVSSAWASAAVPASEQPEFVNAITLLDGQGADLQDAFCRLTAIESVFGRERSARWAARTLDIDIVDFCGIVREDFHPRHVITPHPRAHERGFVLAPLAEVAPNWRHPILKATAADLLRGAPHIGNLRNIGPIPLTGAPLKDGESRVKV